MSPRRQYAVVPSSPLYPFRRIDWGPEWYIPDWIVVDSLIMFLTGAFFYVLGL